MPKKRLFITDDLLNRSDPFYYVKKYNNNVTGLRSIKDFAEEDSVFLRNPLRLITYSNLDKGYEFDFIAPQLIAAGFTLKQCSASKIKIAIDAGIPTILISDENCALEFIQFSSKRNNFQIHCICKLKTPDRKHKPQIKCENDFTFCKEAEKKYSPQYESIKETLIDALKFTKTAGGIIPVYRFSQFLDFLSYWSHMGQFIVKKSINAGIKTKKKNASIVASDLTL